MTTTASRNDLEAQVAARYSAAAQSREEALCCPVRYCSEYLEGVPQEIIDRDYGCGDPTPYVNQGETVLDLGSGGGKVCYILSQVVGPQGRVIGVDCNQEMLELARRYRAEVAERIGYSNVDFRYGLIQDLALDLEQLAAQTQGRSLERPQDWINLRQLEQRLRLEQPMIPDESIDCVVSNCVLNLLRQSPYADHFDFLEPLDTVPIKDAQGFDCGRSRHRHPRETKGLDYDVTSESAGTCTEGGDCC